MHGDATSLRVATWPLGSSCGGSSDGAQQPRWRRAAVSGRAMRAQPAHGCTIVSEASQKLWQPSPHGFAVEDGRFHESIEDVLCQCSQTVLQSDKVPETIASWPVCWRCSGAAAAKGSVIECAGHERVGSGVGDCYRCVQRQGHERRHTCNCYVSLVHSRADIHIYLCLVLTHIEYAYEMCTCLHTLQLLAASLTLMHINVFIYIFVYL